VPTAVSALKGTGINVCTALGYPMGADLTEAKVYEAEKVFALGADQLDFMANIGYLKGKEYDKYRNEIRAIVNAAEGRVTKIMLEFGMLTQEEKKKAAELAIEAGITYVKNSSGWGKGGHATIDDIKLLHKIAGDRAHVKASGGIRTREQALAFIDAGASLIGTSAGVAIMKGKSGEKGAY
jgi:deoxyribose-phosphate aldolase